MRTTRPHFHRTTAAAPAAAPRAAFTMIEIAIALGVIGFALVAIIGILPAGMNVQRETHQDLTIGQDGPFFLEAIRGGGPALGPGTSTSLDFLTNYVDSITTAAGQTYNSPASGQMILGLLTTPTAAGTFNTARVRALTGAATEQSGSNAITSFHYKMDVEVIPFATPSPASVEYNASESNYLADNLYELRLKFSWPVLNAASGKVGPGRQTYRSLVSGRLQPYTNAGAVLWFFQPNSYTNL